MQKSTIILLAFVLFLLPIFVSSFSRRQITCGENEFFHAGCSRRASGCEKTCPSNPNAGNFCLYLCRQGCDCKSGYLRAANGACVLPDDC